jgi:hypothetical protein
MKQLDIIDKQIKRWANQLAEARHLFAVASNGGGELKEAWTILDQVIKDMREYPVL